VRSILDGEDVVGTHSENGLEGKCVDTPEEHNLGAAEVEGNVPFPQAETTASNNLPTAEESRVSELFSHLLQKGKHFAS